MKPSPSGKNKKTQDEMSAEIASFAAKRKEALERAEKLREERKALQRQREASSALFGKIRLSLVIFLRPDHGKWSFTR